MTHADISPEAQARLLSLWRREEQQPFHGWDFAYLSGRMSDEQPPWSNAGRATELLRGASSVVDLGTGGGERLMEPIIEAAHAINHGQLPKARSTPAGDLYILRAKPSTDDEGVHAQRLVVDSAVRLGAQVISPQHTSSVGV